MGTRHTKVKPNSLRIYSLLFPFTDSNPRKRISSFLLLPRIRENAFTPLFPQVGYHLWWSPWSVTPFTVENEVYQYRTLRPATQMLTLPSSQSEGCCHFSHEVHIWMRSSVVLQVYSCNHYVTQRYNAYEYCSTESRLSLQGIRINWFIVIQLVRLMKNRI